MIAWGIFSCKLANLDFSLFHLPTYQLELYFPLHELTQQNYVCCPTLQREPEWFYLKFRNHNYCTKHVWTNPLDDCLAGPLSTAKVNSLLRLPVDGFLKHLSIAGMDASKGSLFMHLKVVPGSKYRKVAPCPLLVTCKLVVGDTWRCSSSIFWQ